MNFGVVQGKGMNSIQPKVKLKLNLSVLIYIDRGIYGINPGIK